ncbi:hypothetical protein HHI36_002114 [Cryptolaemus montrouzieri]|uniref:SPIN-DOC-like zinc-finger domain-containing protein n=1 Tax=Cryptolaemus montrouzieri TaxID=559131 RepID=A0ABD2P9G9_9CUCU
MSEAKKSKTYHFNNDWEEEFLFCMVKDDCICLVCRASVAIPKPGNLERHHETVYKNYVKDFPPHSELRKRKVRDLISCLKKERTMFTRPAKQLKTATIASFQISRILAKHKKPFEDGSVVKHSLKRVRLYLEISKIKLKSCLLLENFSYFVRLSQRVLKS